jgi:hypothetical protein
MSQGQDPNDPSQRDFPPPPPPGGSPGPPAGYGQAPPPAPGYGQAPPPAPGYGQQPAGYYSTPPQTDSSATVALIVSIVGIFFCQIVLGIVGLILGNNAKRKIEESGGRLGGANIAQAARIIGIVDIVLGVIVLIAYISLIASNSS